MIQIDIAPYAEFVGARMMTEDAIFVITRQLFEGVAFKDGKLTFSIINCDFTRIIIENPEEIPFGNISVGFIDCYIEQIDVQKIVSKNISLDFHSSIVAGKVENVNLQGVALGNCILHGAIVLKDLNTVSIRYTEENIFPKRWQSLLDRNIFEINTLLTTKQFFIINNCQKVNVTSNWQEDIIGGYYRRQWTKDHNLKLGYRLTPQQKSLLDINVSLDYDTSKEGVVLTIAEVVLASLSLSGSPNGKLVVENVKIGNWFLRMFFPKGDATFYNISANTKMAPMSKIEIHKCNLDNASFDNINFRDFSLVSFYRTKFSKTQFTSCTFPKDFVDFEKFTSLKNVHYPDRKSDSYYKDQYETFLQLKMALEATGNFYESQKLSAISYDALRKISDINGWDRFILWVNRFSNNHGLSIKRPLLLFLCSSVALYVFYLLSLGRIFTCNKFDAMLIGQYFSFIDLTHRSDFLVDRSEFTGWSLFIDYVAKVMVGFFIFQFIASFRKYGRKVSI
jgi:uncharacterized protein YjbI with pentapeptide repeats